MGISKQKPPSYRKQKRASGDHLAFVELSGQRIYLGRYGSPESRTEYRKRIAEWEVSGNRLPVPADDLTVVELCDAHRTHAKKHFPPGSKELAAYKMITAALVKLYGRDLVADFGPLKFKAVRLELMKTPDKRVKVGKKRKRSRQYVNKLCGLLKRMIKWGVSEEMVSPSVWEALKAVDGLRQGRTELPESAGVSVVADSVIGKTCEHLTPTVAAMVRLQQYTGMRPGEVCAIRTGDLEMPRDGDRVWTYQPASHKTAWRGRRRTIFIGPKGRAILEPWLRTNLKEYTFTPAQSEKERLARRRENRKTPDGQGNEPGTNRQRSPLKQPGNRYTTDTYTNAIHYACRAAFGDDKSMYWSPNQLRHSFATYVRREHGLEAAQVLLGHAKADVTQIYADRDVKKAKTVIAKIG